MLERYPNAKELVWLQEEPENMGPWNFVEHRTWQLIGAAATTCATSAGWSRAARRTGSKAIHEPGAAPT